MSARIATSRCERGEATDEHDTTKKSILNSIECIAQDMGSRGSIGSDLTAAAAMTIPRAPSTETPVRTDPAAESNKARLSWLLALVPVLISFHVVRVLSGILAGCLSGMILRARSPSLYFG
jgi:hypothetical protein